MFVEALAAVPGILLLFFHDNLEVKSPGVMPVIEVTFGEPQVPWYLVHTRATMSFVSVSPCPLMFLSQMGLLG